MIDRDGNPWFILRDILPILGIYLGTTSGQPNVSLAAKSLPASEVHLTKCKVKVGDKEGNRPVMLISESGFYRLVMRAHSSNPAARAFQDWVTRDVLPAIRKDGAIHTD